MTAARHLIVNADDFGQSAGITRGIVAAYDEGVVTSTSLMVRWPAAGEAAQAAWLRPRLSVGLHVDLGEWALREGNWAPQYEVVRPFEAAKIAAEIREQLATFRRLLGRNPTHLDSHQHVHRNEPVRSVLGALAQELGVPLRHFSQVRYCGRFYGQDADGSKLPVVLSVEYLLDIMSSLPLGISELACHPGCVDDLDTMYRRERQLELAILCDRRIRESARNLGIEFCSFHDVIDGAVKPRTLAGVP